MTSPRFSRGRLALLIGAPLTWAVLLLFHPVNGDTPYAVARDDVTRWMIVHLGTLVLIGLMGLAVLVLLRDVDGRAATVARYAIGPFIVFYAAWEAIAGLATGVLVDHANGVALGQLPASVAAIDALQDSLVVTLIGAVGSAGWVVAAIAVAIAFARTGAPRLASMFLALSAIAAMHPPPFGPFGLICFAVGVEMLARHEHAAAVAPPPVGPRATPAGV